MTSAELFTFVIEGISEPVILTYFQTMNAEDFEKTASLFAPAGEMHPPFESAIVGPDAIASYLKAEAIGMKLHPQQGTTEVLEEDSLQIQVSGRVNTPWFGVNVAWQFILNPHREITYAKIKLLASPQELLEKRAARSAQKEE